MPDYSYYLVDCSGRSGALNIEQARFLQSEDVCEWLRLTHHEYCLRQDAQRRHNIEGQNETAVANYNMIYEDRMTKQYFYDERVKCYPVADDGSIIQDHSIMRDIWLSYEVQDD